MAKVVGLVGSASGKIGNVVYAVTNGIQTARVYQPVVSNPKSILQNRQRAKGNLAGRISSFVPRTAIMGLGANNRARRAEFLRNILMNADVVQSGDTFNAKIDERLVLFSKGSVPLSVYQYQATATANTVVVSMAAPSTAFDPVLYASMQTRIVVMVYDITTQNLVEVVTRIANKPALESTATTQLLVSHPEGFIADVYLIPMATSDGTAVSISTSLCNKSDDDIAAALSANRNAVIFDYGLSKYAASASYTPA